MPANELGLYLRELRDKRSLREIEKLTRVSHTRIDAIERNSDPRNGKPVTVNPDTLRKLATAYKVSYIDLMIKAGHLTHEEVRLWAQMNLGDT